MKIIKYILSAIIIATLFTSCTDFLDVNEDPNNPTYVTAELILPSALYTSAGSHYGYRTNAVGNFMMVNWSQAKGFSYFDEDFKYDPTSTYYAGIWDYTYGSCLRQYEDMIRDESNIENYIAISKIMKAFHYQVLVDTYGNIPYSEALQRGANATPKYDDALSIYESLMVELEEAINLIYDAESNIDAQMPTATDDIMFAGDMDKWIKFANTIKLRILVRQSDMTSDRSAYITSEIAIITAEGSGFINEDVAINPGYVVEENKQNPFWDRFGADTSGSSTNSHDAACASTYILNKLTGLSDPRIDFLYEAPSSGIHFGVEQGINAIDDIYLPENVSGIGAGLLKGGDQNAVIFTLADALFLQAEAQFKTLLVGDPKDSFDAGVSASFQYLGAGSSTAYTSNGIELSDYDASTNKLEAIITQKYIAMNGIDAIQSWFDLNRTGYPNDLPMSSTAVQTRPVRLHYPASETTSNALNLPSQPNVFTEKIFWAN